MEECFMKYEIVLSIEIDIDKSEYPNITEKDVVDSLFIQDSDIIDGFKLTTAVKGYDNTKDYFLKNARIINIKPIL